MFAFALALSSLGMAADAVSLKRRDVRITEIMYNPSGPDLGHEFIELKNVSTNDIDMTDMFFSDGVDNCVFPTGFVLEAGELMLVVQAANSNAYPGVKIGPRYDGGLANSGERIRLRDANTNTVVSVRYDDERRFGWPKAPDGSGYSLVIIDPLGDDDDPANWRRSAFSGGSPGQDDPAPAISPIVLNEIMASNLSTTNQGAVFADWIELYNMWYTPLPVSGWFMTDGNGAWWQFPQGASVPAFSSLMIWCNPLAPTTTNLTGETINCGFGLSSTRGEGVFLYNELTNRMDAVSFGLQIGDLSVGRVPDAMGNWMLNVPTPLAANQGAATASPTNLCINEWMSNPEARYLYDWYEIYNTNTNLPVLLSGLWACSSNDSDKLERPLSFIAPTGYVLMVRSDTNLASSTDLPLSAAGDFLALVSETGEVYDRVTFGPLDPDESAGRLPDGSPAVRRFPNSQSPGARNYMPDYAGPVFNEIMAYNRSAVSNSAGRFPDWIELHNAGTNAYDLAGLSLTDDPGDPGRWVFPSNSVMESNAYLRIWCDAASPTSTVFGIDMNCGFNLNRTSDEICLFDGPERLAMVEFGFQLPDVSVGLTPSNGWQLLTTPTPTALNSPPAPLAVPAINSVFLNEWMVEPTSGPQWFEIYNANVQLPMCLSGLYLSDDDSTRVAEHRIGPLCFVGPESHVVFVADADPTRGRDHVDFRFDNRLRLSSAPTGSVSVLDYVEPLFVSSNPPIDIAIGRFPDGAWGVPFHAFTNTPSPGASNYRLLPDIVFNEVLTHTDPPLEDAIELHNTGSSPVDIGGWYLSQDRYALKKFRIPDGTVIAAGGFHVFYEQQFNGGVGSVVPFQLDSALGETLYLSAAGGNDLTGWMGLVEVGALLNGVSAGRYVNSRGDTHFVSLAERSFGKDAPADVAEFRTGTGGSNALPLVGPIVINEIMYHPTNGGIEFVELFNVSTSEVSLFHADHPSNTWRLSGAMSFSFPTNVSLPAGGRLVATETPPAVFTNTYGLTNLQIVLGPYDGKLGNGGGTVELLQPDRPQGAGDPDPGFVPYCLAERVRYDDEEGWPMWADGHGPSLERREPTAYGNDPANWISCVAGGSPGQTNSVDERTDADRDGMADAWERRFYTNSFDVSAFLPNTDGPDGDGIPNAREYILGYDPVLERNEDFRIAAAQQGTNLQIRFATRAAEGVGYGDSQRIYTLERVTDLSSSGPWSPVDGATDIPGTGATVTNTLPTVDASAAYRCRVQLR